MQAEVDLLGEVEVCNNLTPDHDHTHFAPQVGTLVLIHPAAFGISSGITTKIVSVAR